MKNLKELLPKKTQQKSRATERGSLLQFFVDELNMSRKKAGIHALTIVRMAKILEGLEVKDLYFMKSQFEDRVRRNGPEAACKHFWWSIKPQNRV